MTTCSICRRDFHHLGIASHRAACREKKKNGGRTPKDRVLKKYPDANLVKDGCDPSAGGPMGFFDFAVFTRIGKLGFMLGSGTTAQQAWDEAARKL